jgi:hypothetical protein
MSEVETKKKEYSIEDDPLFKPISEDKKKVIDKEVGKKIKSLALDENVDKDNEKLSGQNYALISVVSPSSDQKCDNICLKIKGVFNNLEEANKHAEMLQKINSTFDIYVVEMYSWLLVPPDPELIEQKHVDLTLNEIISGHRESQLKAKMHFEERKRELLENIKIENENRTEENKKMEEEKEDNIEEITDNIESPVGISAESSINITNNNNECPNSGPNTEKSATPSELIEAMVNDTTNKNPSKSWADSVDK